jgi:replicative DNA helicase
MNPREFTVKTYETLLTEYTEERGRIDYEPVHLGFGSIDADLRGISAGQVCGIMARTAVGKTFALATVGHNFSARTDAGCLALSLEMPGIEWAERALAIFADVAPEQVEQWAHRNELGRQATDFLERMQHARVIDEFVRLDDLPAAFAQARAQFRVPLRLVLIDYLGLLETPGRDTYERASKVGVGLKRIAKDEKVAIVVAAQVSRAGGDGSEPVTLPMLRDSGVIEESLDFVLGAWRPGKANDLTPPEKLNLRDVMRVAVLKNRKGADGRIVDLRFRPDSRRLYEDADPFVAAS